ncbi:MULTISPECIES: hypothetical protein [Cutibacterium]|nr:MULTISPECIES: hypothetical protein [Cutibacterium]MCU7486861.1 hypothetical protein [Cutibacterium acnes 19B1]AER05444.1 hypothetical protein TIIST44_04705 [Cutibacterium acnes subsp. defendens ATCC 11828]ESK59325.1 hypothetical protein PAJL_1336 [Cutibacterium acnes HL042PA3]MCM4179921.1 hypothetical protein [Cutibacterium acnes P15]MCM8851014.1 hypothetical protein [Cutibacterium acnes]
MPACCFDMAGSEFHGGFDGGFQVGIVGGEYEHISLAVCSGLEDAKRGEDVNTFFSRWFGWVVVLQRAIGNRDSSVSGPLGALCQVTAILIGVVLLAEQVTEHLDGCEVSGRGQIVLPFAAASVMC